MGETATHASVFAQLITHDGCNHGLHNFLVPIRDPKSLLPYPGVIVGDMGHKIGLNGVDNGFLMFDHYKVPRETLLNRSGDVNVNGEYMTPFKVLVLTFLIVNSNLIILKIRGKSLLELWGTTFLPD